MNKSKWKKEGLLLRSAGKLFVYTIGRKIAIKKCLITIAYRDGSVETLVWTKRLKTAKAIAELIEGEK